MAVDPQLRELLDTLDETPARGRPAEDREMLISVLNRLKIREATRLRPRRMPEPRRPSGLEAELEAAREAAETRQEELDRILAERQQSEEALRAAQEERAALIRRQEELEARLAQLESSSHGGHLSFVEDEDEGAPVEEPSPVVEFSRVDLDALGSDDDLMEFESVATHRTSAFDDTDDVWTRDADTGSWEDGDVAWDEDDDWAQHAPAEADWSDDATWEQSHDDPDPYRRAPADAAQEHAWAEAEAAPEPTWEQAHDDPAPWSEDTSDAPTEPQWSEPAAPGTPELDERTQRDLNELERQLQDLEAELAKRQASTRKRDDEHA